MLWHTIGKSTLKGHNPYTYPAGTDLDRLINQSLFQSTENLAFSTDHHSAEKVKSQISSLYGHRVVVGKTRIPGKRYFARFETGPSTSTEVIAETYPLAICRLAAVIFANHRPRVGKTS